LVGGAFLYFLPFVFQTQARIFNTTTAATTQKMQARARGQRASERAMQNASESVLSGLSILFLPQNTHTDNAFPFLPVGLQLKILHIESSKFGCRASVCMSFELALSSA